MRDKASYVLEQGDIRFVVSGALDADSPIADHVRRHGDGVHDLAWLVDDAAATYAAALARGARSVREPWTEHDEHGDLELGPGGRLRRDGAHVRQPPALPGGCSSPATRREAAPRHRWARTSGLVAIDHVVGNVEQGELDDWVDFYADVMGFAQLLHFDDEQIRTEYSALMSTVVWDGTKIVMPINEPAEGLKKSQIQEYIEHYDGPGVQHIALRTDDIVATPCRRCATAACGFMTVPDTYYDEARAALAEFDLPWDDLQRLNILADKDHDGYLLQIFTETITDRPAVFFEIIERHGARGFGEGNFKALFEAIERDQAPAATCRNDPPAPRRAAARSCPLPAGPVGRGGDGRARARRRRSSWRPTSRRSARFPAWPSSRRGRPPQVNRYPDHSAGAAPSGSPTTWACAVPRRCRLRLGRPAGATRPRLRRPGDEVVYPWPSFIAYPQFTRLAAGALVTPLRARRSTLAVAADHRPDPRRAARQPEQPDVDGAAHCRPACIVDDPADCLVVIDEAYREFVTGADVPDAIDLFGDRPNVAVLRTLSKAYGLAGLRIGFLVADPAVVDAVNAAADPVRRQRRRPGRPRRSPRSTGRRGRPPLRRRHRRADRVAQRCAGAGSACPSQANFCGCRRVRTAALALDLERRGVVTAVRWTAESASRSAPRRRTTGSSTPSTTRSPPTSRCRGLGLPTGDARRRRVDWLDRLDAAIARYWSTSADHPGRTEPVPGEDETWDAARCGRTSPSSATTGSPS